MKFFVIIKFLINELYGLLLSCEIVDEDLWLFFIKWLEKEFRVLYKMFDYGIVVEESEDEEEDIVEINI